MWRADLCEGGEYAEFQGGDFGYRFDYEVDFGQRIHRCGGLEESADRIGLVLRDSLLRDVLCEEFV